MRGYSCLADWQVAAYAATQLLVSFYSQQPGHSVGRSFGRGMREHFWYSGTTVDS